MKTLLAAILLLSGTSFAQVYGDLANDGRAITQDISYKLDYTSEGIVVFDIVVDMDGKVTSCKINREKTTVNSTPLLITAKNRILTGLSFEKGYAFPKFHNGYVQFKAGSGTEEEEEEEEEQED